MESAATHSLPCSEKRLLGLPAFLIFLVFGLSGISIALFSFAFQYVIESYLGEQTLPEITIFLMKFPVFGWIALFMMSGFLVAWWFEKMERRFGQVPRRQASLVAIAGLIVVLFVLTGLSLPFLTGMGATGQ